jgi:hypothetical protein
MTPGIIDRTRNRLLRNMDELRQKLQHRRLGPASAAERKLSDAFREKMRSVEISAPDDSSAAQKTWHDNMVALRQLVLSEDPRNFLSWPVIGGTMFVKYAKYSRAEYSHLRGLPDWSRWQSALRETHSGNPARCPFDSGTSCNLVHHAYHVARFESATGRAAGEFGTVIEFGGGYGSMCRLFFELGFRGRYLIIDLPPFTALQEYFLQSVGIRILEPEQYLAGQSGALCISEPELLDSLAAENDNTLFLATWSISETPLAVRESVLERHFSTCSDYLLAYQPRFGEVDNENYFDQLCRMHTDYSWTREDIEHLPHQRYLFGTRSATPATGTG